MSLYKNEAVVLADHRRMIEAGFRARAADDAERSAIQGQEVVLPLQVDKVVSELGGLLVSVIGNPKSPIEGVTYVPAGCIKDVNDTLIESELPELELVVGQVINVLFDDAVPVFFAPKVPEAKDFDMPVINITDGYQK